MHVHFRRGIWQSLLTQHAKATLCASSDGKRSKHAKNKFKKLYIVAVNAKVKVQLTTSKLSWTHKLPQSEMFSHESRNKVICEFVNFSTVFSTGGSNWQIAFNHRLTRDHTNTCTKPAPYIIIYSSKHTNFQSFTMLTRPGVLQLIIIPKGARILEPSNLRVLICIN